MLTKFNKPCSCSPLLRTEASIRLRKTNFRNDFSKRRLGWFSPSYPLFLEREITFCCYFVLERVSILSSTNWAWFVDLGSLTAQKLLALCITIHNLNQPNNSFYWKTCIGLQWKEIPDNFNNYFSNWPF